MNLFQKIIAWAGGLGVLALAIWLGTIIFVGLLIIVPIAVLIGRWRLGKMRKEFEKAHAQARAERDGQVIETEYVGRFPRRRA